MPKREEMSLMAVFIASLSEYAILDVYLAFLHQNSADLPTYACVVKTSGIQFKSPFVT